MIGRLGGCLVLLAALVAGCTSDPPPRPESDREKVDRYFSELNAAGRQGSQAQQEFLRGAQHPDFTGKACELNGLTLDVYAALSTLRPDPDWTPEGATKPPSGVIYVLGISITLRRAGATLGEQIGSARVALADGRAYGFTPCPSSR
ncbi:hypothetical protein [Amycolatopsis anabasis]|uniref:hypothetical protein n=1 Tax=Amycolatopsis anabasis TaxID=1840409 RepID=UPI00131EC02F|nr:hypothetical protein [Amycolatopsis anabasis]